MKGKVQLRTDGKAVAAFKQTILFMGIICTFLPALAALLLSRSGTAPSPEVSLLATSMFRAGAYTLMACILAGVLLSAHSPARFQATRKKLITFTRLYIPPKVDGAVYQSVRWEYWLEGGKTVIVLYPKGLVADTAGMGEKLSQYMGENMLKYEESDGKVRYTFGSFPRRHDGMRLLSKGLPAPTGSYEPAVNYDPIPIYDGVEWDFTSEALHILLIAPSGAGKTRLLTYLAGMALKRQHRVYIVDAKNSEFGRLFRQSGVHVATDTGEIIRLLTDLVREMEERYSKYFASGMGEDIKPLGLKGHFLFFDEILSVLGSASKGEKAKIVELLGQLAMKGRAAGFPLVITAQKLNANDLPKSITEQCQTRIVLGGLVSEETFHQATGAYKKDIAAMYKGDVGKGYAVTPKTGGLSYIETPLLPQNLRDCHVLLKELRDRGTPYGDGR